MSHRSFPDPDQVDLGDGKKLSVYTQAAAFYVACLKAGYLDEGQEFAEWFLDSFDIDLEE